MIRLLHDPTGAIALAALATARNDPRSGRVSALLAPSPVRNLTGALADVIDAMGKDFAPNAKITGRTMHLGSQLFVWLAAERIRHLAIAGCESEHPDNIADCALLCEALDIDLWVIVEGPLPRRVAEVLEAWGALPTTQVEFSVSFPERAPVHDAPLDAFPVVPCSTVLTFRADARRTLPPSDFERVDAVYTEAFGATTVYFCEKLRDHDKKSIICHLVDLLVRTRNGDEQTTITRGVEAAAIRRNCFLSVDDTRLQRLLQGCAAPESLSDEQWRDLGSAFRPSDSAIAVLSALGLTPNEIASLPASAVSPLGDFLRHDGAVVEVPEAAQRTLTAQWLAHVVFGNATDDRYLDDSLKDASASRIASLLARFSVHLGMSLRRTYDSRETKTRVAWSAERAVSFRQIATRSNP